ncbi:MAG: sulfite exporter TauE/SafE family protein, partial [Pseudomonadota bacterium]|nr:sulfite exporter TauE/SafE family protein [Pseudomonadota bacterium]
MILAYTLTGFAVGTVIGITGVGGGSLMTPILIFGFGIQPAIAIGTDLLFAGITKASGGLTSAFKRQVEWPVFSKLAAGSIPAALLTVIAEARYGRPDNHTLTLILGLALLLTGIALLFREKFLHGKFHVKMKPVSQTGLTFLAGCAIGILVTLTSIGAGAIGIALLLILYPDYPAKKLIATDVMHTVPLTLIAGYGQLRLGAIDLHLLAGLLMGSLPGM